LERFYESLIREKSYSIFNPWFDVDTENDIDISCPQKRLQNLKCYLNERRNAEYLLIAEALGYQGGHFSGIPLTSERIILGKKRNIGISPNHVCNSLLQRTSKISIKRDGYTEPTATIVWEKLMGLNLDPRNFVFWNAFPWHPYNNSFGFLSNRTPTVSELNEGKFVLKRLLSAIQFRKIIALGNVAFDLLNSIGINAEKVRHPAYGGAVKFGEQIKQVI
jgi:hypothetical protein